ncbi:glycoside hydrolase N-terminal domain-containing protein [Horticoccus luteus]|uniref:Glycoside hydrolase N-terminal domain-containing protein n=1 Tax=Horticoccus luteus TaxID=2862869 RepID=A0A8F9XIB6_9BACT|nr:glycoside hydrolase N-terminal domain-containing protein [Horticoccus luteus]QYM80230.1 glycoside hydrolase N-terminal domain-containing protein [Horticoccus luteus]
MNAWAPLLRQFAFLVCAAAVVRALPISTMNLKLIAPITTWDEAVPLGNGLLGGLLWGEGGTLRLSLDRGDLWDERPAPGNALSKFTYAQMAAWARAGKNAEISAVVDEQAYNILHPTKIPAGRLELDLAPGQTVREFELDLASATGRVRLAGKEGGTIEVFFNAHEPVALMRIPGAAPRVMRLLAPESVKQLGYPAAVSSEADEAKWFTQGTAEGNTSCVYAALRRVGDATLLATTVAFSPADGADVVAAAKARVDAALAAGYAAEHARHAQWWGKFWSASAVNLPDEEVMRHYYLVEYFYGAASRDHAPPMPLQGVWTADAGELPPWKGDYHHDLNTEMTYMGYQAAGHFEEGRAFLDWMHGLLPALRRFAHDFYGQKGAAVPAVMSLAGAPLGGWAQYSLSPVHGAWAGHLFYLHWRYTGDEAYLREVAYPWCREVGECLRGLLHENAEGVLVLPVSASPEAFNNSQRAWLTPNSNYDIMCLRMLFLGNAEMAAELGDAVAAQEWRTASAKLGPYHVTKENVLMLSADEELVFSHRHFATLMGIYPFNLMNVEGSGTERAAIAATIPDIDRLGVVEWCGYSYTWMAALRARIGEPEAALWHLKAYLRAFILRNGFHANGDQTKSGFSSFDYRPFTLEGNFLACATVHEMLLQSWNATPGTGAWGPLRIFPAMPWRWHEASFTDLVAEGGHRVSARRENNATTWLRIVTGRTGELTVRDNFAGRIPTWTKIEPERKDGADFVFAVKAGDVIEAILSKPAAIPAAPVDAFLDGVAQPPKHFGVKMVY